MPDAPPWYVSAGSSRTHTVMMATLPAKEVWLDIPDVFKV